MNATGGSFIPKCALVNHDLHSQDKDRLEGFIEGIQQKLQLPQTVGVGSGILVVREVDVTVNSWFEQTLAKKANGFSTSNTVNEVTVVCPRIGRSP